jgi:lysozyme
MNNLKKFYDFINEALTPDQIANQIQTSTAGTGTNEKDLVSAILAIPNSDSMVKVNQALKVGVKTKKFAYLSVGDAINGELGMFDKEYSDQINKHIKKISGEKYLESFVAPPRPQDPVITLIRDRVIKHEGNHPEKYFDSRRIPTIGVGFNLNREDSSALLKLVGANPDKIKSGKAELTKEQIFALLDHDLAKAKKDAQTLVSKDGSVKIEAAWQKLPLPVQGVLTEMTFNLGKKGLSEFNNFLKHIESHNFTKASKEMLDSEWADQVGDRANTLAQVIKSAKV